MKNAMGMIIIRRVSDLNIFIFAERLVLIVLKDMILPKAYNPIGNIKNKFG
jgi:hypothetical protein